MDIFIVRHGETDWNNQKRLLSYTDISLNSNGRDQVERLSQSLSQTHIDVIFSSPLKRAIETSQIVAQHHNNEIVLEESLREVNFGSQEGDTISTKFREGLTLEEQYNYVHPEGESLAERVIEIKKKLDKWQRQYSGRTILLSTHGYLKKAILIAMGLHTYESLLNIRFENSALTYIKHYPTSTQIVFINSIRHLK
jgi:probable phosphoglycerate mutase